MKTLKEGFHLFLDGMDALGHDFNKFQQSLLLEMIFKESASISKEMRNILAKREKEEQLRKERKEAEHKLEEQKRKTLAAFGEEITSSDLVQKVEKLKPLEDEIDNLLKHYKNWEKNKVGKKID